MAKHSLSILTVCYVSFVIKDVHKLLCVHKDIMTYILNCAARE